MLLQAYDFYVLSEKENCSLQIGGSDQWGNITAGIELIRRIRAHREGHDSHVFGLTHPLVSKSDGTKFGKTEQGTLWLDSNRTSPYQFYQFFIQTPDADVMTYLKFFTFLDHARLAELETSLKTEPEKRAAQKTLAEEMTRLVHGDAELKKTEHASLALFGEGIRELDEKTLLDVLVGAPSLTKAPSALEGYTLVDALVDSGLCASKGAARKDIQAGGIYVNNERISDAAALLSNSKRIAGHYLVLRKGKKNYYLIAFK
jgi:tyrosyl-tRNA synthetase